ncbi:MAG: dioxygenase [Crocosphaera sp.]
MAFFPSVFISHGAPDLPLYKTPAREFLRGLGRKLGKPQGILVISAHWTTRIPTISIDPKPKTIYDFLGFPSKVYDLSYPAPGSTHLAHQASKLLLHYNIENHLTPERGLDHGAWNPLLLMYPDADIPVTQLSIQPYEPPIHHWRMGQALTELGKQGILVLGSGAASHNLREFGRYSLNSAPPDWVEKFDQWLMATIEARDWQTLLTYNKTAPYAKKNHPTPEHFLPLFVNLGTAGMRAQGTLLHSSYTYGVLSMSAFQFSPGL